VRDELSSSTISVRSILSPQARGVAQGSAFASTGSAPRERNSFTHQLGASPSASPAEWGAHEKLVADVEACSGFEQDRRELDTHTAVA
jgi:hypothetical protein